MLRCVLLLSSHLCFGVTVTPQLLCAHFPTTYYCNIGCVFVAIHYNESLVGALETSIFILLCSKTENRPESESQKNQHGKVIHESLVMINYHITPCRYVICDRKCYLMPHKSWAEFRSHHVKLLCIKIQRVKYKTRGLTVALVHHSAGHNGGVVSRKPQTHSGTSVGRQPLGSEVVFHKTDLH